MTDDAELLRRYAETHTEDAFAEFVQRNINLVYAAAFRRMRGDAHGAADVTQHVFVVAAQRAAVLARHPRLTGWLYTATRNASINVMRNEHRRREREREAHQAADLLAAPNAAADWQPLHPVLDAAMDELGDRDREAVLLRFFENRPFSEIGVRLRVTENTARMRVERALDKLQTILVRRGITSTSAGLAVALSNQTAAATPAGLAGSVTSVAVTAGAAGAGAATSITFFGIMNATKLLVGGAAVAAAVGFGSAIYQSRIAREASAMASSAQRQLHAVRTDLAARQQRLNALEQQFVAAKSRITALEDELKAAKAAPSAGSTSAAPRSALDPWSNPDYVRAYIDRYRASVRLDYAQLYRKLQLMPEQIERFEVIMIKAQQNLIDVWAAAAAQGINVINESASSTAIARMTSDPLKTRNDEIKLLLGDTGFKNYKEFDAMHTRSAREVVNSLAANVYSSDTPLTGGQGERLTQLIASNTQTVKTRMADDGKKPLYRLSADTDWAAVRNQAAAILSASQISALNDLAERQRLSSEVNRLLSASRSSKPPSN